MGITESDLTEWKLVGRDRDIAEILIKYESATQLNITGMTKVGKTRVMQELFMKIKERGKKCIYADFENIDERYMKGIYDWIGELLMEIEAGDTLLESVNKSDIKELESVVTKTLVLQLQSFCKKSRQEIVFLCDNADHLMHRGSKLKDIFLTFVKKACKDSKFILAQSVKSKSLMKGFKEHKLDPLSEDEIMELLYEVTEQDNPLKGNDDRFKFSDDMKVFKPKYKQCLFAVAKLCEGLPVAATISGMLLTEDECLLTPPNLLEILIVGRFESLSPENCPPDDRLDLYKEPLKKLQENEVFKAFLDNLFGQMEGTDFGIDDAKAAAGNQVTEAQMKHGLLKPALDNCVMCVETSSDKMKLHMNSVFKECQVALALLSDDDGTKKKLLKLVEERMERIGLKPTEGMRIDRRQLEKAITKNFTRKQEERDRLDRTGNESENQRLELRSPVSDLSTVSSQPPEDDPNKVGFRYSADDEGSCLNAGLKLINIEGNNEEGVVDKTAIDKTKMFGKISQTFEDSNNTAVESFSQEVDVECVELVPRGVTSINKLCDSSQPCTRHDTMAAQHLLTPQNVYARHDFTHTTQHDLSVNTMSNQITAAQNQQAPDNIAPTFTDSYLNEKNPSPYSQYQPAQLRVQSPNKPEKSFDENDHIRKHQQVYLLENPQMRTDVSGSVSYSHRTQHFPHFNNQPEQNAKETFITHRQSDELIPRGAKQSNGDGRILQAEQNTSDRCVEYSATPLRPAAATECMLYDIKMKTTQENVVEQSHLRTPQNMPTVGLPHHQLVAQGSTLSKHPPHLLQKFANCPGNEQCQFKVNHFNAGQHDESGYLSHITHTSSGHTHTYQPIEQMNKQISFSGRPPQAYRYMSENINNSAKMTADQGLHHNPQNPSNTHGVTPGNPYLKRDSSLNDRMNGTPLSIQSGTCQPSNHYEHTDYAVDEITGSISPQGSPRQYAFHFYKADSCHRMEVSPMTKDGPQNNFQGQARNNNLVGQISLTEGKTSLLKQDQSLQTPPIPNTNGQEPHDVRYLAHQAAINSEEHSSFPQNNTYILYPTQQSTVSEGHSLSSSHVNVQAARGELSMTSFSPSGPPAMNYIPPGLNSIG